MSVRITVSATRRCTCNTTLEAPRPLCARLRRQVWAMRVAFMSMRATHVMMPRKWVVIISVWMPILGVPSLTAPISLDDPLAPPKLQLVQAWTSQAVPWLCMTALVPESLVLCCQQVSSRAGAPTEAPSHFDGLLDTRQASRIYHASRMSAPQITASPQSPRPRSAPRGALAAAGESDERVRSRCSLSRAGRVRSVGELRPQEGKVGEITTLRSYGPFHGTPCFTAANCAGDIATGAIATGGEAAGPSAVGVPCMPSELASASASVTATALASASASASPALPRRLRSHVCTEGVVRAAAAAFAGP